MIAAVMYPIDYFAIAVIMINIDRGLMTHSDMQRFQMARRWII